MTESRSLNEQLQKDEKCVRLVEQAKDLAISLFREKLNDENDGYTVDPFLNGSISERSDRIEDFANQLIYLPNENEQAHTPETTETPNVCFSFNPRPEESMYLLAAIWLHDIGLVNGLPGMRDGEPTSKCWELRRKIHHERARDFIMNFWGKESDWDEEQKKILGTICLFHRRKKKT